MSWSEIAIIGSSLLFALIYIISFVISTFKGEMTCSCGTKKCRHTMPKEENKSEITLKGVSINENTKNNCL